VRVLHLISSNGLFGAERVVVELCKALKSEGCRPVIGVIRNDYNPHTELAEEALAGGIDHAVFPCRKRLDLGLVRRIGRYLRQEGVDVLHCHGYKANFYGLLASRKRIPTVATNHNWLTSHWRLKVYCLLDALWIRRFDCIVAVSEEIRGGMRRYLIPEGKIRVIDNGIDTGRVRPSVPAEEVKRGLGLNGRCTVVGSIGSLGREKGHVHLLEAAKGVAASRSDAVFLVVGDGPLRGSLQEEAGRLAISDRVIFAGYRTDVKELLSIMDVFVLPSLREGLPMVLLEALAAGKPVVATRVGAVPKVVVHGETGMLLDPGDVEALRRSILYLMDNPLDARKMADAGARKVAEEYSSERMSRAYLRIYNELTERLLARAAA
jgi:glycosyltransferase involved in cell wall biosynthesis